MLIAAQFLRLYSCVAWIIPLYVLQSKFQTAAWRNLSFTSANSSRRLGNARGRKFSSIYFANVVVATQIREDKVSPSLLR